MDDPYALSLPNLRALYLPDEGYALVEADLSAADAQVIAWEAGATRLKDALRADSDLHTPNAYHLYAETYANGAFHRVREIGPPRSSMHTNGMSYRDNSKRWQHATNFAGRARTVAAAIVLPEDHVAACQHWWTRVENPEIGALHDRLEFDLRSRKNPVIHNKFGFRRLYVGGDTRQRGDNLLSQALAWIAQSTVAVTINRAMLAVDCARAIFGQRGCGTCMTCECWPVELLMQHHDSLLCQVPLTTLDEEFITRLRTAMHVVIPYDDPLVIPCEIKWSRQDWGHMHPWHIEEEAA
jgi:hypothetical protein